MATMIPGTQRHTGIYQYSKRLISILALLPSGLTQARELPDRDKNTALGSGNALFNTYSLMTTKAITDGLKQDSVVSRVHARFAYQIFICRPAASGAALWSGDTSGAWDSLRQVSASLNYQMSGIPYWSQDISVFRPDDNTQVLTTRYACAMVSLWCFHYRVHGGASHTEPWHMVEMSG